MANVRSLGKASRDGLYRVGGNPGPGSYELRSSFEGPKYGLRGRHAQSVSNLSPGPAQYSPEYRQRHKATVFRYSMAGRPVTAQRSGSPGPGTYEQRVPKLKKGGKIGREARGSLSSSYTGAVPGPGAYEFRSLKGTQANAPRYSYLRDSTLDLDYVLRMAVFSLD